MLDVYGMRRCKIVFIVFYFVLFYLGRKIEQENVVGLQCRENKTSTCSGPCSAFGIYKEIHLFIHKCFASAYSYVEYCSRHLKV